jgi:uncharacterized protein
MRVVLDTNVLISALLWSGTPGRLIDLASEGYLQLFTSSALLTELDEILHRKKLVKTVAATGFTPSGLYKRYQRLSHAVSARKFTQQICRDADDDAVLACALAANASMIITGDKDLLVLHPWRGIHIVKPADALQRLGIENQ